MISFRLIHGASSALRGMGNKTFVTQKDVRQLTVAFTKNGERLLDTPTKWQAVKNFTSNTLYGIRYYSTEAPNRISDGQVFEPRWKMFFMKRRGFMSRSYDKSNSIDFDEQSNLDYFIPFDKHQEIVSEKDKKIGSLENQLCAAEDRVNKVLIPLTVRDYAMKIKHRFPKTVGQPPAQELQGKIGDEKWIEQEKYLWYEIPTNGKGDMYVDVLTKFMEDFFKKEKNIKIIDSNYVNEYNNFVLKLCESIAEDINFANKLVAHTESPSVSAVIRLNVFDNVIDPYLTIFYNALVGKNI